MGFYYGRYNRYGYNRAPVKRQETLYKIQLVGNAYQLTRDNDESIPEGLEQYQMQSTYTGKLFTIMAESLYNSVALYILGESLAKGHTYPVVADIRISCFYDTICYIKLEDPIGEDFFTNNTESKESIINRWATTIKENEHIKPLLKRETEFISWDPGKGSRDGGRIFSATEEVKWTDIMRASSSTQVLYFPKDDPTIYHKFLLKGILRVKAGDNYIFNQMIEYRNANIEYRLNQMPDRSVLTDPKKLDDISDKDFVENYAIYCMGSNYRLGYDNSLDPRHDYISVLKEPEPGTILKHGEMQPSSIAGEGIYHYIKREYPDFYKAGEERFESIKKELAKLRHDKALDIYEKMYNRNGRISAKQTHMDIIESFIKFRESYKDETLDIQNVSDLYSYTNDIFGCVLEHLSEKVSNRMTKEINDSLISEKREHPRKRKFEVWTKIKGYSEKIINDCLRINSFADKEIRDDMTTINQMIGDVFPTHFYESVKQHVQFENDAITLVKEVETIYKIHLENPVDAIQVDCSYVSDNGCQGHIIDFIDNDVMPENIYNKSMDWLPFKRQAFHDIVDCLLPDFEFKVYDKNWDDEYPPYMIYLKFDEDKLKQVIDKIKNDPLYIKIVNDYHDSMVEANRKRDEERKKRKHYWY